MKKTMFTVLSVFAVFACAWGAGGDNLAKGKLFTSSAKPAENTLAQLTDGTNSVSVCFVTSSFVPLELNLDLGSVQNIDSVNLASFGKFGVGGVMLPFSVRMLVSDDCKSYRYAGDLAIASAAKFTDWDEPRQEKFTLSIGDLKTSGRYVKFVLTGTTFFYVDEIEIYAGTDNSNLKNMPVVKSFAADNQELTTVGCIRRFNLDLRHVVGQINASKLDNVQKTKLLNQAEELKKSINVFKFTGKAETTRLTVPFNDLHRDIYKLYGQFLALSGAPALQLWQCNEYYLLRQFKVDGGAIKPVELKMLGNDQRCSVFNLTNGTAEPAQVFFKIAGLPKNLVSVYLTEFTDTMFNCMVSAALVPLADKDGVYTLTVPAGMTRQVWLSLDSRQIKPGTYAGKVEFVNSKELQNIPMNVYISGLSLPAKFALSAGLWDQSFSGGYGINADNSLLAMQQLVDGQVDLFDNRNVGALPKPGDFDAKGKLIGKLDFSGFDKWVKVSKSNGRFFIFLVAEAGTEFDKFKLGSPEYNTAVIEWAKAWEAHARKMGMKPKQVVFHYFDEPRTPEVMKSWSAWTKAFLQGSNYFSHLFNPCNFGPELLPSAKEALQYCDIFMPVLNNFINAPAEWQKLIADYSQRGGEVAFYMCSGPTRIFDPDYYRLMAWYNMKYHGQRVGFWVFQSDFPWNEYLLKSYYPVIFTDSDMILSKSWMAMQEGRCDFGYYQLLKTKIDQLKKNGHKQAAEQAEARLNEMMEKIFAAQAKRPTGGAWYMELWCNDLSLSQLMNSSREQMLTELETLNKLK